MTHLEKFGLLWVEKKISKLVKKLTIGRETRKTSFRDESTIWSFTIETIDMTKVRGIIFRYFWFADLIETYFGISSANPYQDLTSITIGQKNYYMAWFSKTRKDGAPLYQDRLQRWSCFCPDASKKTYFHESMVGYLSVTKENHGSKFFYVSFNVQR